MKYRGLISQSLLYCHVAADGLQRILKLHRIKAFYNQHFSKLFRPSKGKDHFFLHNCVNILRWVECDTLYIAESFYDSHLMTAFPVQERLLNIPVELEN